ncbi:SDR family NAD(P)-dependent oxidoreductase [Herbidospora sp. NBRC 101105]|uniref:SDR family NAD(P)-dependent oxidoreductase n=1 Tax=Herbidospora sp. NBRC 101105 TaxID=3032195 RepID=UPI0024A2D4E8|nr:SDR family NAD(P)-dependent oxidoreductase [Herbidospora sp. NBRC 101105]GLX96352.1 short-chain dehydrogenase/reductase [Herbidospora sp. NBRC 101105]
MIWFVTGSSRGLGREIVLAALERGDGVAATARNPAQLDDLAAKYGDRLLALPLDVTDPQAVESAVAAAVEAFGTLDVVVNNAGWADTSAFEDTPADNFRAQVETNFFGVVNVTRSVVPILRGQGHGSLINVSSIGGRLGTPGLSAYQASKWAVNGFTEVISQELAPLGVKVTTIEPGGMTTDWGGSSMTIPPISEPYRQTVGAMVQVLRQGDHKALGDPAKVAQVIVQLTEMDAPPIRLLLGSDALNGARYAARTTAERDAAYEELSRSTDRDDATAYERDPLGQALSTSADGDAAV